MIGAGLLMRLRGRSSIGNSDGSKPISMARKGFDNGLGTHQFEIQGAFCQPNGGD